MPAVLQGLFVIAVCVALGIILVRGSQPALTPEQIVQQESYQGEQQARRIFNLNSARKEAIALTRTVPELVAKDDADADREVFEPATAAVADGLTGSAIADEKNEKILTSALPPVNSAEVPAVSVPSEQADGFKREPVELSSENLNVEQSVVESPTPTSPVSNPVPDDEEPRMLPVYRIRGNQLRIYASASESSRAVATISSDDTVTLFSTDGDWAEVAANDGSGITGYVRRSAITALKP